MTSFFVALLVRRRSIVNQNSCRSSSVVEASGEEFCRVFTFSRFLSALVANFYSLVLGLLRVMLAQCLSDPPGLSMKIDAALYALRSNIAECGRIQVLCLCLQLTAGSIIAVA